MLSVTVLSAIEALKADGVNGEVVVVENSDPILHEAAKTCIAGQIKEKTVRVIRLESPSIAKAIHLAHQEARGEFIFYTDAHTFIAPGTIKAMLDFFRRHEGEPIGFLNASIQWAHRSSATKRTHMSVEVNPLGAWAGATCISKEQKVPWKGMPYMIRKSVWDDIGGYGCCAEHELGWGILSYIGVKSWIFGYENWAIPDGVVYHFGEWPQNVREFVRYRTYQDGGKHPGLAKAVTLYVFGGEEMLRKYFDCDGIKTHFRCLDDAILLAREFGSSERLSISHRFKKTFQQLLSERPWDDMTPELISPNYRQLNEELHQNPEVLYGYKGWEQADLAESLYRKYECGSALDYGAGKQSFSSEMRIRGIEVTDYDPAIPHISNLPNPADLVVCSDVLEHVEPEYFIRVMNHIRSLVGKCLLVRVCLVPCTSKTLPDGSDPHRIVKDQEWWLNALEKGFDVREIHESSERYLTVSLVPN